MHLQQMSTETLSVGQRVQVRERGLGTIVFIGVPKFSPAEFVGIQLAGAYVSKLEERYCGN